MSDEEEAFPELSAGLKQAIALQTMAALYRSYHSALPLRLVELHPGGGMYHCLALSTDPSSGTLCMFNLSGSSLKLDRAGELRPPAHAPDTWHSDTWRQWPQEEEQG